MTGDHYADAVTELQKLADAIAELRQTRIPEAQRAVSDAADNLSHLWRSISYRMSDGELFDHRPRVEAATRTFDLALLELHARLRERAELEIRHAQLRTKVVDDTD